MADGTDVTRKPTDDQVRRFKDLMGSAREQRSEANSDAGEAREILKGLGFGSVAIAMYKRLTDMSDETGPAVFEELCQLLDADPAFPYSSRQADMFADAAVKEAKGNGKPKSDGKPKAKTDAEALAAAQQHLGTGEQAAVVN